MLGLPRQYHLDDSAIDPAWRSRSRLVHPDRFSGRPAVERRMSLQWTAMLNDARRVIKDPVTRARYLATGRARVSEERGPPLDPDFLEQMFDLRMQADEDPASVLAQGEAAQVALRADLDAIFSRWEAGNGTLDAVEERLARLKYIDNLLATAHGEGADH